jgi:hypothetical protein
MCMYVCMYVRTYVCWIKRVDEYFVSKISQDKCRSDANSTKMCNEFFLQPTLSYFLPSRRRTVALGI